MRKTFDVEVKVYEGILNTKQADATILKLGSVVADYDMFKLAGTHLLPSLPRLDLVLTRRTNPEFRCSIRARRIGLEIVPDRARIGRGILYSRRSGSSRARRGAVTDR